MLCSGLSFACFTFILFLKIAETFYRFPGDLILLKFFDSYGFDFFADQKSRAGNVIEKVAGIEEAVVKEQGIMIAGAETATGMLTVIMGMIENVKERGTDPAATIQGVVVGHVHDQESELGIMIAIGMLSSTLDFFVRPLHYKSSVFMSIVFVFFVCLE